LDRAIVSGTMSRGFKSSRARIPFIPPFLRNLDDSVWIRCLFFP